ncbi:hypothetical protein FBY03_105156 [Pseudomonas sp. SJZ079]|nr:hypothetical protein FBY03_105156 [Pseudomonas sp. SJZ079]
MRLACVKVGSAGGPGYATARDSGLIPLQHFAKNLRRYARGILASARFHMHTNLLDG